MFKFSFELNENDYLEFNKYHNFNSPSNKKTIFFVNCFIALLVGIRLFNTWFRYDQLKDEALFVIISIILGIVTTLYLIFSKRFWSLILIRILKMNIKNLKKQGKFPYNKEAIMQFDEDSFIEIIPQKQSEINYSQIERIAVGDIAVYIYTSAITACIIPFTAFSSEENRVEFLEFLKNKTLKTKKK